MSFYDELVLRNGGYVPAPVQQRIRGARVLIAGCGIGSTIAESLVRVGFERLTLVDRDEVALHNLNRQDYVARDVGRPKVECLAERLRAINPELRLDVRGEWVDESNASALVADADVVVDTIDFLDLPGIVALHDAARAGGKPVVSAVSVGYGAGVVYFPPDGPCTFRQLFDLPEEGPVQGCSATQRFIAVLQRVSGQLDPDVVRTLAQALGNPCPAPQLSVGAASVGALATTMVLRLLTGRAVTAAPRMVLVDMAAAAAAPGIDVAPR